MVAGKLVGGLAVRVLAPIVLLALVFFGGATIVTAAGSSRSGRIGSFGPVLGRTVVVIPVAGRVMVLPRGARRFVLLKVRRLIGVGSTVDTSRGIVRLQTASQVPGKIQHATLDGGAFMVTQDRSALTDLSLRGGRRNAVCRARVGAAARLSPRVLRTLHAHGTGRFRTKGRYAAATVRGTDWTTADRCDGTMITDRAGHVATASRVGTMKRVLQPGQSVEYRCSRSGAPPVSTLYCVNILSNDQTAVINGRAVRSVSYDAGVGTRSPDDHYDLCVRGPRRRISCTGYPFAPPDQSGNRLSAVACVPDQGAGDYTVSWRVRGVSLGAPLTYHASVRASIVSPCSTFLGQPFVGGILGSFFSDFKDVNRYSLPTAGSVRGISTYLTPTGVSGQQVLKGIVYADSGGAPGPLLGVSNELTFRSTDAPGWYFLAFPTHLNLAPGSYWIGVLSGLQSHVAGLRYDRVPGSLDYNANAYTSGPSDPFGPISVGTGRISLFAFYDVAKP